MDQDIADARYTHVGHGELFSIALVTAYYHESGTISVRNYETLNGAWLNTFGSAA